MSDTPFLHHCLSIEDFFLMDLVDAQNPMLTSVKDEG
jgi:hypothetical protein